MPIVDRFVVSTFPLLMVAGCDGGDQSGNSGSVAEARADCATGGNAEWSRSCRVERDGDMLILRDAEGGFRRFRSVSDGRGLVPADGAEQAEIRVVGKDQIEMRVGDDRYRLPATMAAVAP